MKVVLVHKGSAPMASHFTTFPVQTEDQV